MKKILISLLAIIIIFMVTGCGNKSNIEESPKENNTVTPEKKDNNENIKQPETHEDKYIEDDEIIDLEDDDNYYPNDEYVVVEKVINCDGCVYAYFSDEGDEAKKIGSTLSLDEYTTDINNLKTGGNKQRHNFFGLVLSGNTISKAYACILKDKNIYCIQGSVDGTYFTNNIGILNQIFTANQCRYISDGHTYTCTDGSYNGDTKTNGYTSLHYETSCTIYGADAKTGSLICH